MRSPASASISRPSRSASGRPGRTASATTPPAWTLTASGTNCPDSASWTLRATAVPALSCASAVLAPRCGVTTTFSSPEQRRLGRRLLRVDVDARAADAALAHGVGERLLVDDPAAGRVDEDEVRLDQAQLLLTDEPERLGRLRQVDADHVRLAEHVLEAHQPHPELRRPLRRDVGVVGDDVRAERGQPLGEQHPDPPETPAPPTVLSAISTPVK